MSQGDAVRRGVEEVFRRVFPELQGARFDIRAAQNDLRDWDSFTHMQLVSALEEKFGIQLEVEEMLEADSVRKCIDVVARKLKKNAQAPLSPARFPAKNFSEVLAHWAFEAPDKTFLHDISAGKTYSYAEFDRAVNACVRLLKKRGVRPGDSITLRIRNSCEFLILYFASVRLGSIVNPVPFSTSDGELARHLGFVKPKLVFLESASKDIPKKFKTFRIERKGKNSFARVLQGYSDAPVAGRIDPRKPACLYYSSGTTANPKGVLYSHANMIALIASICEDFGHGSGTKHLGMLPMGHTAITNYSFLPVLYAGGTLVFAENFISIRKEFWNILEEHGITYVEVVPTILFSILNTKYPGYSRKKIPLPYVGCGSAPLPLAAQKAFQKRFGIPVANLYGLSETGPSHFDDPRKKGWKPGSIGVPLSVNECAILDDRLRKLPAGRVGEIALKGKNVFIGYHKNEKAYRAVVKKGFFLTGDLGYKGKNGLYYYVDRKKDLIIKGGSNIFPGEVDEVLFKHPAIREASTIGVPDEYYGEDIVSFVVLKKPLSEPELQAHAARHLQRLKRPKRIIAIPAIPQTHSGKLLRRKLRALYAEKYVQ